ncbi:MAG: DUF4144 family protein [Pseudohongiellaceae bacterium]
MKNDEEDRVDTGKIMWPAFIKFDGDNGLLYIEDQQQWLNDSDLHSARYEARDRLIDSTGEIFSLSQNSQGQNALIKTGTRCSIASAVGYVQAYAAEENYCCSAKIHALSFNEVLTMISDLDKA